MKWLLITVLDGNPGDSLICRGVERIVRAADPFAEFDYLDKTNPATWAERPFDRAILCGMPLFWDEPFSQSNTVLWWSLVNGWPSADSRRFMPLGVGSCCSSQKTARDAARFVRQLAKRSWRIVTRDNYIVESGIEHICCPAAFALDPINGVAVENIVNLMPNGGHWDEFNPREASIWRLSWHELAEIFYVNGWKFVAHAQDTADHARREGWRGEIVVADTLDKLIEAYRSTSRFFGNRVHGAIASCGAGAHAWCVGYDSRRFAVDSVGGMSSKPSELNLELVRKYAACEWSPRHPGIAFNRAAAWHRMVEIVKEFAA